MLLNISQCAGQTPTTKNYLAQVSIVLQVEVSCSELISSSFFCRSLWGINASSPGRHPGSAHKESACVIEFLTETLIGINSLNWDRWNKAHQVNWECFKLLWLQVSRSAFEPPECRLHVHTQIIHFFVVLGVLVKIR